MLRRKTVVQFGPTDLQRTTRTCLMQAKFANSLRVPSKDALDYLRRRIRLYESEIRTSKEELNDEVAKNNENIEKLRKEISKKRLRSLVPGANEFLMRKALKDHHTGSSVFREKEPRDVNEGMDDKTCDLRNKLNQLRNEREKKMERLNSILTVFNDTVEDVVFLEFEGPMGDSRCLGLENHIAEVGKKHLEAERLHHTYQHVRDELDIERQMNDTAIKAVTMLIQKQEDELAAAQKTSEAARRRKEDSIASSIMMEVDNRQRRKDRNKTINDMKKKADEQKHEFNQLRKNIQSYFATQETVPLGHPMSTLVSCIPEISEVEVALQEMEKDFELLQDCTATHSVPQAVSRFEEQRDKFQHLRAMVRELEARKLGCVSRLSELSVVKSATICHDQHAEDAELEEAVEQHQLVVAMAHTQRWSVLAASSRVTQALVRLRQLLEYLVAALVAADMLRRPPRRMSVLGTEEYLPALLQLTMTGAAQLMATVGHEEADRTLQRAAAAQFTLTRSEERVKTLAGPATLAASELAAPTDEGETTGSEVVLAGRHAMKESAQLMAQAKIKAGFGKKKW